MRNQVVKPSEGIAWITGASSGIGFHTALKLASEGWTVAATARRESELEQLATAAAGHPGVIHAFAGDVTDRERMAAIITEAEDRLGPVALAILNAGIYLPVDGAAPDATVFEKSVNVNILGTVYCFEPLIPRMVNRAKGHIAIVSSVTGYGGLPTSSAYGATKAALINIAECLKIELDRYNVRVSIINPGFVETPAQDDNEFPKPFMISAEEASERIVRGLKRQAFEITFPKRFTYVLKWLKCWPRDWYIAVIKRQTGWNKPPEK